MNAISEPILAKFMEGLQKRNPGETEFHQAVYEVAASVFSYITGKDIYHKHEIMRRIAEPDRIVSFRVCWEEIARRVSSFSYWEIFSMKKAFLESLFSVNLRQCLLTFTSSSVMG